MKKIPGFYAWITSILMFLSAASFAAVQDEVQLDYSVSDGIYVNMPTSGTKFLTVPSYVTSFKVFDDGGSEDDYSSNANGCLVIVSQGHSLLRLSGETEFFGGADDYFSVYDGTKDWTRELLRTDNPGVLTPLTSSRDTMSICFESGQDVDGFGLDLAVTLVPVYEIVFEQNADEGTLSSDKDFANSGATVTLTATPSAGYMLTGVNIVGADETPVTPTINDDKVTFTMPEGGVTVTPNFEKVTFDEDGCLANENMYYHMDCDAQTHVCTISQILTTSPDNMPVFKDFKCWHVTRYSHQECDEETGICEGNESEWDEGLVVTLNDDYSSYNVALASDIDLGGFDDAEGTCVADFAPLAATHSSFDGQDYSINGLCWKGGISGGFYAGSPSGSIENVTFKNAYIEVQGTDSEESRAGVISPALSREARISYVTIDGATVIGDIVGGVVGVMDGMQASVPSVYGIDVKNSTIRAALSGGALVGEARAYFGSGEYAFAGNSISGSGNLGGFVGVLVEDCSFASDVFVSDSGTTVVGTEGTGNVGGFAGLVSKDYEAYIMGGEEISIERISIIDGNLSGGENIGGLVGSAVVDIPLIIANNFVTSAIGTTGASKKGYIVGDITTDKSVTVYNNYHYSEVDAVELGIGSYNPDDWTKGSDNVYANVRNAVSGLEESGTMNFYGFYYYCNDNDESGSQTYFFEPKSSEGLKGPESPVRNGVATESDMKSDKFAALLNSVNASSSRVGWIKVNDKDGTPINNGLPFLVSVGREGPSINYVVAIEPEENLLSDEELSNYGFYKAYYGYTLENCSDQTSTKTEAYALTGYTKNSGLLDKDFVKKVNDMIDDLQNGTPSRLTHLEQMELNGNVPVVLSASEPASNRLNLVSTKSYDVVYQYCDGEPAAPTTICENIDADLGNTLVFMAPKIDVFKLGSIYDAVVPPVVALGNSNTALSYDVEYLKSNDDPTTAYDGSTFSDQTGFHLISEYINDELTNSGKADIKTVVLKYYDASGSIPTVSVSNPQRVEFVVNARGETNEGTHESIGSVSTYIAGQGAIMSSVNIPFSSYFVANDFKKAGYNIDSYSISFVVTSDDMCGDDVPEREDEKVESFNSVPIDTLISIDESDCIKKSWTIHDVAVDDEVDLGNVQYASTYYKDFTISTNLSVSPVLSPIEYAIEFNLNIPGTVDSSTLFLGHNWNSAKTESVGSGDFPRVYSLACPSFGGWNVSESSTAGYYSFKALFENEPENVSEDEESMMLYSYWNEENCQTNTSAYIDYYAKNGELISDVPEDMHGSIELLQNIDEANSISHMMKKTKEVTVPGPTPNDPEENYYAYRVMIPDVNDTLSFNVVVTPDPGYSVGEVTYESEASELELLRTEENLTLGYSDGVLNINPRLVKNVEITAAFSPIAYTVSFDISSLEDKIVVLGRNWAPEKENVDVETNNTFPSVYVYSELDDEFNYVAWNGSLKTYPNAEWASESEWREWVENNATFNLTSAAIAPATKDETKPKELAFYPIDVTGTSLDPGIGVSRNLNIYLKKKSEQDITLAESENDFHGNVVISQTSGDLTFSQASQSSTYSETGTTYYRHTLLLPDVLYHGERFEFDVRAVADAGYEMSITDFTVQWNDAQPNDVWGYDEETGKLVIHPDYMLQMDMFVDFTMQHYNVSFAVPDEELFVANKIENKKYLVDWFDWKADASVEDSKMPPVYNAKGCRVGWKLEGSTEDPATELTQIFKRLVSVESDEDATNVLVLDTENEICNQKEKSYTQTLTIEEGMGTIRLVQVLGTAPMTEGSEEQKIVLSHSFTEDATTGETSLQVPQAFNMVEGRETETGVTFMVVAEPKDGYTLDHITYVTSKNGNIMDVTQGDSTTLNVMEDLEWHVYFKKLDPVYVTYGLQLDVLDDISGLFLPTGAVASETLEIETDKDSAKFWIPYHTSKCFAGWSLKQDNAGMDLYKSLNAGNFVEFSNNEDNPTKLFAIWKDCELLPPANIAVSNGSTDAGLVLFQVYEGDTIRHSLESSLELNGTSFDFYIDKVNTEVEDGYTLGKVSLAYKTANDVDAVNVNEVSKGLWRVEAMDENGSTDYTFNAKVRKKLDNIILTYNENSEGLFYGSYWRPEDVITEDTDLNDPTIEMLPVLGRTDACFMGWAANKNATVGYTYMEDLVDALGINDALSESPGGETTTEEESEYDLYAVWDEDCTPETFTISSQVPKSEGSFELVQNIRGRNYTYSVLEEGLKLPVFEGMAYFVEFKPMSSNKVDSILVIQNEYMSSLPDTTRISNGDSFRVSYGQTDVVLGIPDEDSTYKFILSVNVDDDTVFFGTSFSSFEIIAEEDGDIPMNVYRKGYKLVGWTFDDSEPPVSPAYQYDPAATAQGNVTHPSNYVYMPTVHKAFDEKFAEDYAMYELTYGETPDTLFAVWKEDPTAKTVDLVNLTPNVGNILLVQYFGGYMFEYELRDTLTIPYGEDIGFMVDLEADYEQWGIDERRAIKVFDEYGERIGVLESYNYLTVAQSMGLAANIDHVSDGSKIKVAFDLNTKDSVFFGSDWQQEAVYEVGGEFQHFPALVYTSDKCIAGWSKGKKSSKVYTSLDYDLIEDLESDSVKLYARWTADVDSCSGFYMVLPIEQEHGTVQLVEGDGLHARTHEFTSKGTMILPYEVYGGDFRVVSKPDSSYMLDSLVVSVVLLDRSRTLFEGDAMPDVLEMSTLKAYFGKANKTPIQIVDTSFVQSGNAIQLSFKASDFEVTRGVSARVQVIDSKDSVVIDSLLGDSVAMGYGRDVVLRVNRVGEYRAVVTLEDSLEMDEYTKEFFVKNEIESIAADSWQMLSLAAVDTSVLDKRDSDQIFYWWDEEGTGEFWQYKQFVKGDEIVPTRGVWYSSLEARPLKLRDDIDDDGKDFVWELDSVSSGWNLIANTHGWMVDLYAKNPGKKKAVDEEADVTFYHYDAQTGGYYEDRYLKPYEAIWAKVTKKTSWKVSAEPVFKPEEEPLMDSVEFEDEVLQKRVLAKASTKERWTLQAVLYDGNGKKDSWNIFGAGLNPFTAAEPPESMGDHVNLSIVEGRHALAKSIRNASDDMEWNVALSASSDRMGYLSLAGIAGVNALGYHVYVTVDGNTTEMKEGESLKVYLKENAKTATIRVAPAEKVVAENSLKGLRMARLGGKLQVTFNATGLAGKSARVDLMDMKGHVISTVSAKTVDGSNALLLDAPQTGLYMLRVRAGSQQQATKVVVK